MNHTRVDYRNVVHHEVADYWLSISFHDGGYRSCVIRGKSIDCWMFDPVAGQLWIFTGSLLVVLHETRSEERPTNFPKLSSLADQLADWAGLA